MGRGAAARPSGGPGRGDWLTPSAGPRRQEAAGSVKAVPLRRRRTIESDRRTTHDRGVHHRRGADPDGPLRRRAEPGAPRGPRRPRTARPRRPHRYRPGRGGRRHLGLRRPDRRAGLQPGPQLRARGGVPRTRAGGDHRPPVRLVAAGRALRRPGRHVGHDGHGDRRRHRGDEPRQAQQPGRRGTRPRDGLPVRHPRLGGALRRRRHSPVPRRQPDRRALGHHRRGHERPRPAQPPQSPPGLGGGTVRHPGAGGRRLRPRRGHPPEHHDGEDGHTEAVQRVRPAHGGHVQPDHRRGRRPARGLGRGRRAPRPGRPSPGCTRWPSPAATRC